MRFEKFTERLQSALSAAQSLAAGRDHTGIEPIHVLAALLQEPAEQALHQALTETTPKANQLFDAGDYTASLQALAVLKAPVDQFFESVMVNAEDPALKANRLGLLANLHQAMNRVADLSKLAS